MAAAANGMALHGGHHPLYRHVLRVHRLHAPGVAPRRADHAQRVIHVLTHDSIGLGEDGPTHQPVEHLASLRAMPNLHVFRPADAMETAECWELAIRRTDGPSLLVLTRQALPAWRTDAVGEPQRPRRLRPGRGRGPAPGHADRHRIGGADRHGGARRNWPPRASTSPSYRCRAGNCSHSRTRLPCRRCWAARRASASRPPAASAGSAGWARMAFHRHDGLRRSAPVDVPVQAFRHHPEAVAVAATRRPW